MNDSVFLDSDVIICSLISSKGAAFEVLELKNINLTISDYSEKELQRVVKRLGLDLQNLKQKLSGSKKINLKFKEDLNAFVSDKNDIHILQGAVQAKVKFLLTYNEKHFNSEKIKRDLDIIVMPPGKFLQYLRSR